MREILVIIGGSGSGKTTVAHQLVEEGYERLITTTTRPMRVGEVNHLSYHFVSVDDYHQLEKIEENNYLGNWYGLTKAAVEKQLENPKAKLVVVLDVNGAEAVKRIFEDLVTIVFLTVLPEEIVRRMRVRGDSEEDIQSRLQKAFDANEFSKPHVAHIGIENMDITTTIETILHYTNHKTSESY